MIPVSTWSPNCNSDMVTDFPFASNTLPEDGKQLPPPDGGGGGGGGGTGTVKCIVLCIIHIS